MFRILLLPISFFFLIGSSCTTSNNDKSQVEDYFPENIFRVEVPTGYNFQEAFEQREDSITRVSYRNQLIRMNEQSIFQNCNLTNNLYRFTWLPSFHTPFTIRVKKDSTSPNLVFKFKSDSNDRDQRSHFDSLNIELVTREWKQIVENIDKTNFWNLKTVNRKYQILNDSTLLTKPTGNDGATWIIEGCAEGSYHIVDRWSGNVNKEYRNNFTYLLKIAEMDSLASILY